MPIKPARTQRTFPAVVRRSLLAAADARSRQLAALDSRHDPAPVAVAHRQSVERILSEIVAAIGRMEAGTYGDCTACGGTVELQVLVDRPWSSRCDWCASRPS